MQWGFGPMVLAMSTKPATIEFVLRQLVLAGDVSVRAMFGEYAIYARGKLVALVCDDIFYLKPTAAARTMLGTPEEGAPYPGAKPSFVIGAEAMADAAWFAGLIAATWADLPAPKPKAAKKVSVKKLR